MKRLLLPLDLVIALDEILQNRLVPLEASRGHQLHPVAVGRLVGRLGAAGPDRDVRIAGHEVLARRAGFGPLDGAVDQDVIREIELEVVRIERVAVAAVSRIAAFVQRANFGRCVDTPAEQLANPKRRVLVPGVLRIIDEAEARREPPPHAPPVTRFRDAVAHPPGVLRKHHDPLVVGIAMRVEKDVGQPLAPDVSPDR